MWGTADEVIKDDPRTMILQSPTLIAECDTRVLRFFEDSLGVVYVISNAVISIDSEYLSASRIGGNRSFLGVVDNKIVSAMHDDGRVVIYHEECALCEVDGRIDINYATCFATYDNALYILADDGIWRLNINKGAADMIYSHESDNQFEKMIVSGKYAIAFSYGLIIVDIESGKIVRPWTSKTYNCVYALRGNSIIAADSQGSVDVIDLKTASILRTYSVAGHCRHLSVTDDDEPLSVVITEDEMRGYVGERARFTRRFREHAWCEAYASVDDQSISVGCVEGNITTWDPKHNTSSVVYLPTRSRIVNLHWSSIRQELFIGDRDGRVFVARKSGTNKSGIYDPAR